MAKNQKNRDIGKWVLGYIGERIYYRRRRIKLAILNGWKPIMKACGIESVKTMKRKAKRHKMPIVYVDGKPTITEEMLIIWWMKIEKCKQI